MPKLVNPFTRRGHWYKANLHTHTTVSDGALSPAERVVQYREAGYSVLAITDHRKTQDISGLGDKQVLVVSGMECHPVCREPRGWFHLVALGVPQSFKLKDAPKHANQAIARIRAAGGIAILAHPAWCGQSFADFRYLKGLAAIEVWNSTCDRAGRPSSENEWADALDHGWRLPAVAADDCHRAWDDDVCESWTWLKMPSLTVSSVLRAIETGACYASRGPVIHDFRVEGGRIRLRCSPAAEIHFVSVPGTGERRRAAPGRTITSFTYDARKRHNWPWDYVRAVVTDTRGRKAWANPIYL